MKITKQVLALMAPALAAGSLFMGCGGGDTVQTVNNITCPEPGGSYCNGSGSGVVCAEGSRNGVAFSCAQGEVCEDGACVGQCEANATECVGEQAYRTCSADGKQWVPVACQAQERCVDGACVEVCEEGEVRCKDGKTQEVCSDGAWEAAKCPSGTACVDGACTGECTVGETRCDASTHDLATSFFSFNKMNLGVLWTCKDGKTWTVEPCGDGKLCSYSGIDPAEVDRYHAKIADLIILSLQDGSDDPPARPWPEPPEIPRSATASCVEDPCPADFFMGSFVEYPMWYLLSPRGFRQCGLASDSEVSPYEAFSECTGLPPFAPLRLNEVSCSEGLMCAPERPALGCQVPACDRPGETYCEGNALTTCSEYTLTPEQLFCSNGCEETDEGAQCIPSPL